MLDLPSKLELAEFPRWALAAYATRCALRVLPTALQAIRRDDDDLARLAKLENILRPVQAGNQIARGDDSPTTRAAASLSAKYLMKLRFGLLSETACAAAADAAASGDPTKAYFASAVSATAASVSAAYLYDPRVYEVRDADIANRVTCRASHSDSYDSRRAINRQLSAGRRVFI